MYKINFPIEFQISFEYKIQSLLRIQNTTKICIPNNVGVAFTILDQNETLESSKTPKGKITG